MNGDITVYLELWIQFPIFPTLVLLGLRTGSIWAGRAQKTHYRYLGDLSAKKARGASWTNRGFRRFLSLSLSLSLLAFELKRVFRVATGLFPTCYK